MTKAKGKPTSKKSSVAKKPTEGKIERWLEANVKTITFSILGIALLLRIWLLIELPSMPFSQLHKAPDLDMNFFDLWGDRIANGDILTNTELHPYHNWHKAAAEYYGVTSDEQGKAKWNEWYGGKVYHQEPIYAYLLGICKMIAGDGHMLMFILQIISTLFSIWMIIWLGRHYFGTIAGLSAGLMFALYSPAILFDVMLLRTSLTTVYMLALLMVAEKLMMGKSKPWILGVLGGVGYLLQTTVMLLWIPLVIRWLYCRREDIGKSWQAGVAFAGVLSLLVIRNVIVGVSPLSASSVGPVTFVLANFPEYKPELGFVYFAQVGKLLEATHGSMIASAMKVIGFHSSIFHWIVLELKKLGMTFHWFEVPNNVNTYLPMKFSLPLRFAFIPWSFIGGLGLAGIIFNLRNTKTLNLLMGILSQVIVMVAFYVLCRFRVPMVAMMAVFGGYVIQELIKSTSLKRKMLVGIVAIAMWAFMLRPYPRIDVKWTSGELAIYFHTYYREHFDAAAAKKDYKEGIRLEAQFLNTMPDFVKNISYPLPPMTQNMKDLIRYYGKLNGDLGDFYKDDGQQQKADECYRLMDRMTKAAE